MNSFPSIKNPSGISQRITKKTVRATAENGAPMVRARQTKALYEYTLTWSLLSTSDLESLLTFFDNNTGLTFSWLQPVQNITKIVIFAEDSIEHSVVQEAFDSTGNLWNVSLKLQEVV
jgi:hypothetical protein